ncbi:hypothetical protein BRADI_1g46192v3 [Brachypodium distachyon]|uniref:Transposase (putative) gypsy type domain-containing protein n=1 Tax=Brachypodium distachyon TaxID=15368 RepID=A0A2K2DPN7_BRADI|nr:hypothetical protein BRADI_1g46192v3 [Brachypodium distachyon]
MGRKKVSSAVGASAAADGKRACRDAPPALDKKSKKAAKAAPGGDKKTGEWKRSGIMACHLSVMRKHGLIPGEDSGKVRVPGNEVTPRPKPGERVVFYDFVIRGLSLPAHFFFHALLLVYGLQMHDQTPNSYLHIACFIKLCACYLGVEPHWGLWKKLFIIKRQGKGDRIYKTGGANIQVRGDVQYFSLHQIESVQQWRTRWFYLQDEPVDGKDFSLPEFSASAQVRKLKSWNHELTAEEDVEATVLLKQVAELQQTLEKEVSGVQLIALFMKRRIQSIQARAHSMWEYSGSSDSTRICAEDLSDEDLLTRVGVVTRKEVTLEDLESPLPPYGPDRSLMLQGHPELTSQPPLDEGVPADDDETVDCSNSDALYEDDMDEEEDDHQSRKHGRSSEAEQSIGDSHQHEVPEEMIPSSAMAVSDEPKLQSPSPSAPLTKKAKVTVKLKGRLRIFDVSSSGSSSSESLEAECLLGSMRGARFFTGEELARQASRDGTDSDCCSTVDFSIPASYWGLDSGKPCLTKQANRLRDVAVGNSQEWRSKYEQLVADSAKELAVARAEVDAAVKQAKLEAQESLALERKEAASRDDDLKTQLSAAIDALSGEFNGN